VVFSDVHFWSGKFRSLIFLFFLNFQDDRQSIIGDILWKVGMLNDVLL